MCACGRQSVCVVGECQLTIYGDHSKHAYCKHPFTTHKHYDVTITNDKPILILRGVRTKGGSTVLCMYYTYPVSLHGFSQYLPVLSVASRPPALLIRAHLPLPLPVHQVSSTLSNAHDHRLTLLLCVHLSLDPLSCPVHTLWYDMI